MFQLEVIKVILKLFKDFICTHIFQKTTLNTIKNLFVVSIKFLHLLNHFKEKLLADLNDNQNEKNFSVEEEVSED